ncbi:transporter [Spirochaetia bacterium]|nr:transporter [Spirochaetia bacterium]
MAFMNIISQVLVLFFLMLAGFVTARLKATGPEMAGHFSSFIINFTLPAMLFASFQRPFSRELLGEGALALGLSAVTYAVAFAVAFIYPRLMGMPGPERGVHRYAIIISNCGFIGYPMVEAILGPSYVFHAVIFNIPFSFLAYSVCAWLISKEGKNVLSVSWKTFANPNVIATFLGLIFFLCSLRLPEPLYRAVKMTGDITSPLSMIVIGITLAQANIRQIFGRWRIYVTTALRLLILPMAAALLFYFIGVRGPLLMLAVLITAMPVGSTTSILASLYRVAPEEASSLVFLSTLLCMFTVPLLMFIMQRFFVV